MLQVNVSARYTAEEILSHPWVLVRDTQTHLILALISEGTSPQLHTNSNTRLHVYAQDDAMLENNMMCEASGTVKTEHTPDSAETETQVRQLT